MYRVRLYIFAVLLVLGFSIIPVAGPHVALVAAQSTTGNCSGTGGFVPLACFNQSDKLRDLYTQDKLENYLSKVFMGSLALGAILAVLRLSWAGFVYMSSDLWSSKGHAKEIIQETMLGLFLLLAIWLILNLINPKILKLKFEPEKLKSALVTDSRNT